MCLLLSWKNCVLVIHLGSFHLTLSFYYFYSSSPVALIVYFFWCLHIFVFGMQYHGNVFNSRDPG